MEVVIHSKKGCPSCLKAKAFFKENNIEYKEVEHNDKEERLAFYEDLSRKLSRNIKSVPQIFVNGEYIGTYTSLLAKAQIVLNKKISMLEPSIVFRPFRYPWANEIFERHEAMHWVKEEVGMDEDISDWKIKGRLTDDEKNLITNILRMFTQGDVQVASNYYDQLIPRIKANEIRNMLGSFAAREGIHQVAYALLNDSLGFPDSEYHSFLEYQEMLDKIEMMASENPSTQSGLAHCMARSVFNEGVMLFSSFAILLNFERRGRMKGMCKIVEWSVRDEMTHVEGVSKIFRSFCVEKPRIVNDEFKSHIYSMAEETIRAEDSFIDLVFSEYEIEGLTKEEIKLYIRYIGDRRLIQLGLKPIFGVKENPLVWMENLLLGVNHTSFFEGKSTDYDVAGGKGKYEYSFIEDFS